MTHRETGAPGPCIGYSGRGLGAQDGGRRSTKAVMPSAASAEANSSRRELGGPGEALVAGHRRHPAQQLLGPRRAPAGRRAAARRRRPARSRRARTPRRPGARVPASRARSALTRSPVRNSSAAIAGGIRRRQTVEITAGATPTRTSENANRAPSTATDRSQAATSPLPATGDVPLHPADHRLRAVEHQREQPRRRRPGARSSKAPPGVTAPRRSAPAQNVLPRAGQDDDPGPGRRPPPARRPR